jgi:hypothetical protein
MHNQPSAEHGIQQSGSAGRRKFCGCNVEAIEECQIGLTEKRGTPIGPWAAR